MWKLKVESYCFILFFIVFIVDVNMAIISFRSLFNESYSILSIISLSNNNSNQYAVSSASFKAIDNLWIKSTSLWAFLLSLIFAPILVPLLKICLAIIYYFFSSFKNLENLIILTANCLDLSATVIPI